METLSPAQNPHTALWLSLTLAIPPSSARSGSGKWWQDHAESTSSSDSLFLYPPTLCTYSGRQFHSFRFSQIHSSHKTHNFTVFSWRETHVLMKTYIWMPIFDSSSSPKTRTAALGPFPNVNGQPSHRVLRLSCTSRSKRPHPRWPHRCHTEWRKPDTNRAHHVISLF